MSGWRRNGGEGILVAVVGGGDAVGRFSIKVYMFLPGVIK